MCFIASPETSMSICSHELSWCQQSFQMLHWEYLARVVFGKFYSLVVLDLIENQNLFMDSEHSRFKTISRCACFAALFVPAHNHKFMHAFSAPVPFLSPASVHDKHANWTIIKPNTEKNINSHIVRLHTPQPPTAGCLLLACFSSTKENFQFAIRATRANRSRCGWCEADENTWSQITLENVNQYWLSFDCFPKNLCLLFVDQLKVEDSLFISRFGSRRGG